MRLPPHVSLSALQGSSLGYGGTPMQSLLLARVLAHVVGRIPPSGAGFGDAQRRRAVVRLHA